ncbi:MAG: GNAT family N-acetyltransferase [Clostridia bacterium]|nr:GNAT family N-acetyltransferase [Clostridia bacterium]
MNVYEYLPVFESTNFKLRGVCYEDADDLLKVYSDKKAVPFFNGDNCHGDNFYYTTKERMQEAIKFWLWSYDNGYFVRWAIIDKKINSAIGSIELFHRDDEVAEYDNCGLLRLDLRSDYEKESAIKEILSMIEQPTYDLFGDKIVTKVKAFATERHAAVKALGFSLPQEPLRGQNGEEFNDYYLKTRGDNSER